MTHASPYPHVYIVGGGLAGQATAIALAEEGFRISLIESRRQLGGRATSYSDASTGDWVDHCQHVSLGCCTNFADFCCRTGLGDQFERYKVLHFIGPDGHVHPFRASDWLPPPMHLAGALWGQRYLSIMERLSISTALLHLARTTGQDQRLSVAQWLKTQNQSPRTIERFWKVVLTSALAESLDRASLSAAKKVFVDGFMGTRHGYDMLIPKKSLAELFAKHSERWLRQHMVEVALEQAVRQIHVTNGRVAGISFDNDEYTACDVLVLAVPWHRVSSSLSGDVLRQLPGLNSASQLESSPITGIHLWMDRPLTTLRHAVLIGGIGEWLFRGNEEIVQGQGSKEASKPAFYHQVVVSASRHLRNMDRNIIIKHLQQELAERFPSAGQAKLIHWKIITEQQAVFSVTPGSEELRPPQQTEIPNLMLAGDWTATGWPSTMEGAVRSGYLAAEAVMKSLGKERAFVVPDAPHPWLTRKLLAVGR